ncbi:DUF4917 domain-containing protein [Photorhabdus luminescens]|uniref:DUF4917 domain-containing protein n=1 Tax=Photorhabdus akhurstii TaxID=171438 RepID=A0ABX8LZA1_9GAMM|nr:DUF4917 family protein [Photorhabdus akhurstii]PQQ42544.1 DUF4917 domain-containing protein [Photorhabdus luminescens]QXF35656.1 DUF4917 domain-containing protein [Photorhabdus akhurstii]UJD77488.1 DUF4917 domain-containing protein [Photorhabdus luminescens]
MPFVISPWSELAQRYDGTILLGNGASIAVSPRFAYGSLLEYVRQRESLAEDARRLFDFFETEDFELILRIVWQASNVNKSLQIEDVRTHGAYLRIRECLIQAVRDVHPEHNEVSEQLPYIYDFLKRFNTVISLNYDLIVYWTMTYGLDIQDRHKFKDCFLGRGVFAEDWQRLRTPYGDEQSNTLVFYPHGSLVLCRNRVEQEHKIHIRGAGLLESILERWKSEEVVPLFVSEGTYKQKVNSIQNSFYLSKVYREVLAELRENLVILGWGMGEHDIHLLKRMAGTGIQRVAVSVFRRDRAYCNRANLLIKQNLGQNIRVEFFDSESPGCWNIPTEN